MTTKFNTLGIKSINNLTDINGTSIQADNITSTNLTSTSITATSTTSTNLYVSGAQGVQGSFGFLGCQTLQGLQGYFNSSLYAKDNYVVGIQGVQGSFRFLGCQTLQGQQGYLSSSLNVKDLYTTGIQGTQSFFNFMGCQTIQGQQGYISSSLNVKDLYTTGLQGTQSFFNFMGCQTIQGQQGYLSSSLNVKDLYTTGIQGTQSFFRFSGVQTIQGQQGYLSSSLNCKDIYTTGIQGVQSFFGYNGCVNLYGTQGNFSNSLYAFGKVQFNGSVVDSTILEQGSYLAWNYNVGTGETDIINKSGLGGGGIYFYNTTGNSSSFNTGRTLMCNMTPSQTTFYQQVSMRQRFIAKMTLGGLVSYTAGNTVAMTQSFMNDLSGTASISSGVMTLPSSYGGYYSITFNGRVSDTSANQALIPLYDSTQPLFGSSDTYYWIPVDNSSRRCFTYSTTRYFSGGNTILCKFYANTTIDWIECSVVYHGTQS